MYQEAHHMRAWCARRVACYCVAAALLILAAIAAPVSASERSGSPGGTSPALLISRTVGAADVCNIGVASSPADGVMSVVPTSASPATSIEAPPATLGVSCALPFQRAQPGSDCNGWHTIQYATTGAGPNAKVTAELLALDLDGNVIQAVPVKNGDAAHMNSRINMADFRITTKKNQVEVSAPIPVIRVMVEDQGEKVQAFCSNIPYLQVVEPKNQVVAEADGNVTNLLAAIPLAHGPSLDLKVDGVHVFDAAHLNLTDPTVCTLATPCEGTIQINGAPVKVSNLAIDLALSVNQLSSNTLRASFEGLACGGHVFVLNGARLANMPRVPTTDQCHLDNMNDKGGSSIFAITITSPTPGEVTALPPTTVTGQVCSGRPVTSVKLNGLAQSIVGSCTPGDGEDSGTTCTVPINTQLGQTDLVKDISTGDETLGKLDAGSNRLVAAAMDDIGTRTYKKVIFATGLVAAPGIDPNAAIIQKGLSATFDDQLREMLVSKIQQAANATSVEIDNAFVVGLSAAGTQKLFDQLCAAPNPDPADPNFGKTPTQIFTAKVKEALLARGPGNPLKSGNLSVDCACDPPYKVYVESVDVANNISCPLTFSDGKFHVGINLPDVTVTVHASGSCEEDFLGACVDRTVVDMTTVGKITGINLGFDVTEANLLNSTTSTPNFVFNATQTVSTSGGVDLQCLGADICEVVLTVLTLGQIDFSPEIDISKTTDFSKQVGAAQPDPVKLNEIKVDEEVVANFDQKLSGKVSSVRITSAGITAGLKGTFATTAVDPETEDTPGAVLTPAPVPTLPVPNAQDVFIGLSDDALNMMFASMTTAGKLATTCNDTNKTLGDLLPANCDSLTLDTPGATAAARGACYGVRVGANCEALTMPADANGVLTATAQGVCHAYKGDNCNALPLPATLLASITEKTVCANTPNPNLRSDQALLFCARADIPPRMLLEDNSSTSAVEAALRVNDLSVAMVVDRDGSGNIPGPLADVGGCFANGAPTNVDCNMFASCIDLNFNFNMQFQQCEDGKPGFKNQFTSIQVLNRQAGAVCGGTTNVATDSTVVDSSSTDSVVTIDLTDRAEQFAPPVCGAGLTLGGFVSCDLPTLLAINSDSSPALKDYIAITCKIQ